jgi:hypothetical protein|tara:strand:+ start:14 stop:205 length:192 start_codon:yes stop_codon:yes gene_type:complete
VQLIGLIRRNGSMKGKGTQIGTDAKPLILGKKRRRPNVTSQAYRDNFDNIFSKKERKCPILEK